MAACSRVRYELTRTMTPRTLLLGLVALIPVAACSGNSGGSGFGDEDAGPSGSSSGGSGSGGGNGGGSGSSSGVIGTFGDASTEAAGQCPPCSAFNVNLPNSNCDLDCSNTTTPPASCDQGLVSTGPATDFAKALGVCQQASSTQWGLVSATYTRGYNSTAAPADGQHAILGGFGSVIKPREGANLGVLSSGFANMCDDASPAANCSGSGESDPYFKGPQAGMYNGAGAHPPGYPKSTTQCPVLPTVYDTIGVTLQIRVPNNAQGFSFDFDFYSGEWPEYVCTDYNDSFVAWLNSTAWTGTGGDLNISFDSMNNPVSVNNGFFDRCTANTQTGCSGSVTATASCAGGPSELQGTGFYNLGTYCSAQSTGGGATGWLTTKAPVTGGEVITLQFIIWDTGDQNWDSSVLVDNLQWYGTPQMTGTTRPVAQ
jgi:hypothetical protein